MGGLASVATFGLIKPPKAPKAPAAPKAEDPTPDANAAAERRRKKNSAAYGRADTILTGPQGTLGSAPMAGSGTPKTILGG